MNATYCVVKQSISHPLAREEEDQRKMGIESEPMLGKTSLPEAFFDIGFGPLLWTIDHKIQPYALANLKLDKGHLIYTRSSV